MLAHLKMQNSAGKQSKKTFLHFLAQWPNNVQSIFTLYVCYLVGISTMWATPYVVKSLSKRNTRRFRPILKGNAYCKFFKTSGNGVFWALLRIFHTFHGYVGGYAGIIQGPRGSYPLSQRNTTKLMIPNGPKLRKKSLKLQRNVPDRSVKYHICNCPALLEPCGIKLTIFQTQQVISGSWKIVV